MRPLTEVAPAVAGEAARMLTMLDAGFPAVWTMTAAEARAAVAERVVTPDNLDDAMSDDRLIDGPGGDLRLRIYRPRGDVDRARPAIVFFHGGGFVFCSIESHDGFCRRMARNTASVVISVDYRLAPEHKAPAAAEDAYAATTWVAEHHLELGIDPAQVVVAGDSAGGNLAAVVSLMARDRRGPAIAGQVLLYPVIEPDFTTRSHREFGTGNFNTTAAMRWYWKQYLGDGCIDGAAAPRKVPSPCAYVIPTCAESLADLPPAIVVTAGRDPLSSEGRSYVAALREAGVAVSHRHYPELFHGFLTIGPFGPAESARQLLWADLTDRLLITTHLGRSAA
ncbi:MAG TPA: alpha/beta hydrolase [Marmoricola sp.]|nr:alpha/beta hydrolase [Marmoricola sp.]